MTRNYGILARFATPQAVYHAAEQVRDAGFKRWDVITPFPIHGMDAAMGLKRSKVPVFCFLGGLTGFLTGVLIVWYMGSFDYPLIVGGKPYFSFIFPFPIFYELTILLAAFGAFFGQFITNFLPRHHHPVMAYDKFQDLTNDAFAIVIEQRDPKYSAIETRTLLEKAGAVELVDLPDEKEASA